MSLGSPLWLLLILLAGVLVYFHRQRRAQRAALVGSLHLWRRLALQSAPRARPRVRLSAALLLQGLVLALVALALARPGARPAATGGDVLLLIEAGRSMRATDVRPDRFGAAVAGALGEVEGRTSALLVADWPVPLAVNREGRAGVRAALRSATAGDGAPDWTAAARMAQAWIGGSPAGGSPRVIAYVSPGQAGAARAALRPLEATIRVIGGAAPNAAMSGFAVTAGRGGAPWALSGAVRNFGPAGKRNVTVALDGRVMAVQRLNLAANGETPFALRFTPGQGGVLSARLDASDVLPADDAAQVVLRPTAPPLRVALVGPPGTAGSAPGDPAGRGAAALPGARVTRSSALPAAGEADLLIVTDPARQPGETVPAAPVTLWLNAPQRGSRSDSVLAWDTAGALGQGVPWGDLGGVTRAPTAPWPTATALLTGRTGPLIELRREAGRTEVRVNMPLDSGAQDESGWTGTPAFPVFLSNLAHLARPDAGERTPAPCRVGQPCALPAGSRRLQLPAVDGPAPVVEGAAGASFVPWRAGIATADGQPIAVSRLAGPDADLRSGAEAERGPREAPARISWFPFGWRDSLAAAWRPLLLLALLTLIAELVLLTRSEPTLQRGRWATLSRPQRRMLALHGLAAALLLLAVLNVSLPRPGGQAASARVVLPGTADPRGSEPTVWGTSPPSPVAPTGRPDGSPAGDLAAALEVAAASLPGGTPQLLRVQEGRWPASARLPGVLARLRSQGTAVVIDPSTPALAPALTLGAFETPAEVAPGQPFAASLVVLARAAGEARLVLRRGDRVLLDSPVVLQSGLNRLALPLREDTPGTAGYVLGLSLPGQPSAGGTLQAFAATRITPAEAVLIVGPDAAARRSLGRALQIQEVSSRDLSPQQLTPALVAGARRITLLDTPAQALDPGVRAALDERVRSGGHLLLVGAAGAFGPGGYVGTTLETLSPLSGRVPRDLPRLALGLALDKSGSMNERVGGEVTKLDLIKSAALNSALLLSPQSDIAVIAFDSAPKLAVPLTRASNQAQIRAQIGRIEAEGGTVVKRALEATLKELLKSGASRKHLILLTDGVDGGIFSPEEYRRLIRRIRATGITVSTVSVGSGMHIPLMRDIALWGEGRFAQAQDWRDVPSLLARDTLDQGESAVKSGAFAARWPDGTPLTLGRYARTTLKPGATPLGQITPAQGGAAQAGAEQPADPLAATWRVGLGSVSALAALPTDAGNSLARRADFPARLAALVRGPGPLGTDDPARPTLVRDGADLVVSAPTPTLELSGPQGTWFLTLQPGERGQYQTRLYAPLPGGYSAGAGPLSAALGLPPTAQPLKTVLEEAGGSGAETLGAGWAWQETWPAFALLALLSFFAGLALRYLPERAAPRPAPVSPREAPLGMPPPG
ncbi:VWA domain-containing protein [Deinococcus koreensis]|uniref:VWFA domain-containing protein n=1 Tax=Deinococcus koreensis TaxID=2054903 RepID=A0A2K3UUB1_9DEIO|nr:VWA domain-containing protein [Deinococcus koreensis]PNY80121.1 hypothetical protein CVO96_01010 [Deinococcus koreensis]